MPYPNLQVLAGVAGGGNGWRRHVTAALLLAAVAALCIAVARPKMTLPGTLEKSTVVLVLDVSGSMDAKDVKPTRLEAARAAVNRFLDKLPTEVRVGLIAFSTTPEVIATPTNDRDRVRAGLEVLLAERGTAIGDSVARGAQLAHDAVADEPGTSDGPLTQGEQPLATVLFLSDGAQRQGLLTPDEGAQVAHRLGVPVYTVALGTDEGVIETYQFGELRVIPVPPDRPTLKHIAEVTGGEAFEVRDEEKLTAVSEGLGNKLGRVDKPQEVTVAFAIAGATILTFAGLAGALWLPRLP
jgi:Ca-activated chloride channel family protein